MRKIRLLIVLRDLGMGGTERQVVELCRAINKEAFEVTVALFFDDGGFLPELKETGVSVRVLGTRRTYKWNAFFSLLRLIRSGGFDIIYSFLPIPNLVGGFAGKLCGKTTVSSLRVNYFSRRNMFCWMDVVALRFLSDYVTVNSRAGCKCAIHCYGARPASVKLIYNGRDFSPAPAGGESRLRAELGIENGARVIVSIGRVSRQKGFEFLVEAARIIADSGNGKAVFLIVGKPEDAYQPLVRRIENLNLGKTVRLLDARRDIAELLEIADLFVLASLWEGFPNVLLEAMSAGKAIVATNIPGNDEVISDGKTGIMVPPADAQALARAVSLLLEDQGLARRLGEEARCQALRRFSAERLAQEHMAFYREVYEHAAK